MQERAFANPKIRFGWNRVVTELVGDERLEGVKLRDVQSGSEEELGVTGLFVAIGHSPNTGILKGQVELDSDGYVLTSSGTTATSVDGVFAAGDVADKRYRQAVTAAGSGCMAALDVERWLEARA
jgi:thioredoxin reductase (NADPH)